MKKLTACEEWNKAMWEEDGIEFGYDDETEYFYTQDGAWNQEKNVEEFRKFSTRIYEREVIGNKMNIRKAWVSWFRKFDSIGESIKVKCGALLAKVVWLELACKDMTA